MRLEQKVLPVEELAQQMREILIHIDPNLNTQHLIHWEEGDIKHLKTTPPPEWVTWRITLSPVNQCMITRLLHTFKRLGLISIKEIREIGSAKSSGLKNFGPKCETLAKTIFSPE